MVPSAKSLAATVAMIVAIGAPLVFGQNRDDELLQRMLRAAKSDAASERMDAAKALGGVKSKTAADALLLLLQDKQWFVRLAAVDSLKSQNDPGTISALSQALKAEKHATVQEHLKAALESIRSSPDSKLLALQNPDPKKRAEAAQDLSYHARYDTRFDQALIALLEDPEGSVRRAAAAALVARRNPAVIDYEIKILQSNGDAGEKMSAAESLGELQASAAVDALIRALADHPAVRASAIVALGRIGDARAAQPLIGTLDRLNEWYQASLALTKIGEPGFLVLMDTLNNSTNETLRANTVRGLGLFKDKRATPPLIKALTDPSGLVREHAALALAEIGDRSAVVPLTQSLCGPFWYANASTAAALGRLRDPRAVTPLIACLKKSVSLQEVDAILTALGEIGTPECSAPLAEIIHGKFTSKYTFVDLDRYYAAESLGRIGGKEAESVLYEALRKQDQPVVSGAHRFFIAIGRDGSEELLIAALNREQRWRDQMARAFLLSDNARLAAAARTWASAKDVTLSTYQPDPVKWKQGVPKRVD